MNIFWTQNFMLSSNQVSDPIQQQIWNVGSAINQPTIVQLNQKQFQSCYEAQIFDFKSYITVYNVIWFFLNQSYVEKLPPCRCICIDNTPLTSGYIFLPRA